MKRGRTHTPEARALMAARARQLMADPAMRRLVSKRTKKGMAIAAAIRPELQQLRSAWRSASPEARRRFLAEALSTACKDPPKVSLKGRQL